MADGPGVCDELGVQMLSFGFAQLTDQWATAPARPYWRLYWFAGPGARLEYGGARYDMRPNQVAILPPHTPIAQVLTGPVKILYLHWQLRPPFDHAEGWLEIIASRRVQPQARAVATEIGLNVFGTRLEPGPAIRMQSCVVSALSAVPDERWPQAVPDLRVAAAMEAMRARPGHDWSVPLLAAQAGLTANAFSRVFREHTGLPPMRYLRQRRLEAAARALIDTSDDLDLIAEHTGFCDRYHLSRWFSKQFTCGPASYRRRRR
ncbi:MAG: AraC family transcriptional regulator [Planctomycetota bacterium]|jgi:AraC-like DNA-binding protein|nr:AraC family transcriptional regulator [Planctomycetota bacterium]